MGKKLLMAALCIISCFIISGCAEGNLGANSTEAPNSSKADSIAPDLSSSDKSSVSIDKNTILGSWQKSDGSSIEIDANSFGKADYEIKNISVSGSTTVIQVSLNGGKSISSLVFDNNDADHFTLHNTSTGYTEEYTRR